MTINNLNLKGFTMDIKIFEIMDKVRDQKKLETRTGQRPHGATKAVVPEFQRSEKLQN